MHFNEDEKKMLIENPNVVCVVCGKKDDRIIYSEEFKAAFAKKYVSGAGPTEIFRDAGFDTAILGHKRIERASARWRRKYLIGGDGEGTNVR